MKRSVMGLICAGLCGCTLATKADYEFDVTVSESYYSSNGDGRISPGEAVELAITVLNNTSEVLEDAEIHIVPGTDQTYNLDTAEVVAADEAVAVESIYVYSSSDSQVTPSFGISFFELEGETTSIPVEVRLVHQRKTKASKKINIELRQSAANMKIGAFTINTDTNDDGLVNPGEFVDGSLTMVNTGSGDTQSIEWNISLVSGPATLSSTYTGSDYSVEVDGNATQSIRFDVAPDAQVGDNVVLEAWILEETGRVWTDTIKIPVQASNGRMVIQGYELTGGDGIPTAGESENIQLQVENTGTSSVPGVTGFLSAGSEYVTVTTDEESDYGVSPGETWTPTFRFVLSEDMPSGHEMPFYLTMEDSLGNIYTDSFTVIEGSGGISLELESTDVRQVTGDGDSRVEPGESFYVDIEVGNDGGVRANGVSATLRVSDSHIDLSDTSESLGVIQPGESSVASGAFRFLVLASHPGGWVDFEVELTSGSMTFNETFQVQVH